MLKLSPLKIILIYVLISVAWITSSDLLVEKITTDLQLITELSLIKGWFFVGITATVLYGLVRRYAAERAGSEAKVRAEEKKYRDLIETTGTGFAILDDGGCVLDANEEYVRLTGHRMLEEILGRSVAEWTAPYDLERNAREVLKCLEQGSVRNLEIDYVNAPGSIVHVEINSTVIDLKGERRILSMVRNITERRKTQEARLRSEQRYHSLFYNTPLGISVVGMDRRIIDCNPAFQKMLGYSLEELKAMSVPDISVPEDDLMTRGGYRSMVKGDVGGFTVEKRYLRKDGSVLWTNLTGTIIRDEKNEPHYTIGIIEDITERKRSEEALRESEEKYRSVVQNIGVGIALISPGMTILSLNRQMQEWFPHIEANGTHLCYHEFNAPPRMSPCSYCPTILTFGDGEMHEAITETPAGEKVVNYRVKSSPIRDSSGKVIAAIEMVENITERRKTEQDLLLFRSLLDRSHDAIFVNDPATGRFLMVNDKACSTLGYGRERLLTLRTIDIEANFPDQDAWDAHVHDVRTKGHLVLEGKHTRSDGTLFPVEVNVTYMTLGGVDYMVAMVRDITERRSSEQALRTSEERMSRAQQMAHVGNWEWNIVTNELYWSEEVYHIYGVDPSTFETTFDAVDKAMHPDDRERFLKAVHAALYEHQHFELDYRLLRPDGTVRTVHTIGSVTYDAAGKPLVKSGTVQDVTEQRKLEEALRSSRDFIERILNTVDEAFIVIDRDYRITMANKAYATQAGLSLENIIGKHCHEISHQSSMPCFETGEECAVRQCFETGTPHSCVHRHTAKNGDALYVETKAFPLTDATGTVTSAIEVINNITDKHLLEEQMLRTQKLEAVGLLAGGIAHDFNNLLQGVFGSISLAKMFSDKAGQAHTMLDEAEAAMYQATHLTKQLLTFSKGGEPVKRVVALPALVQQAVKFALSGSNVSFRSSCDEGLWTVEADEGQLNQVIHNIVLNAGESMPDGGTIDVELRNVVTGEKSGVPLEKGNYVRISISDSGTGIPEQHLARIFDPYFTTKQRGSGLGLATSYSIIRKHGGVVTVDSRPGDGSAFHVYLPASGQAYVPAKAADTRLITGRGKVLVMDDEEIVRRVAGLMIGGLGYEVDFAENGEEAVEKYKAALTAQAPFAVVILDLTVRGGMGGKETLDKLKSLDPAVRAIVSSGYSADDIIANFRAHGFHAVLSKPYQLDELGRLLQEVLRA